MAYRDRSLPIQVNWPTVCEGCGCVHADWEACGAPLTERQMVVRSEDMERALDILTERGCFQCDEGCGPGNKCRRME